MYFVYVVPIVILVYPFKSPMPEIYLKHLITLSIYFWVH